jgi:hypothetical protein
MHTCCKNTTDYSRKLSRYAPRLPAFSVSIIASVSLWTHRCVRSLMKYGCVSIRSNCIKCWGIIGLSSATSCNMKLVFLTSQVAPILLRRILLGLVGFQNHWYLSQVFAGASGILPQSLTHWSWVLGSIDCVTLFQQYHCKLICLKHGV